MKFKKLTQQETVVDTKGSGHLAIFTRNFTAGMGFMIGATIGFSLFLAIMSLVLNFLGGLPIVGDFFANVIVVTNRALEVKKSLPIPSN